MSRRVTRRSIMPAPAKAPAAAKATVASKAKAGRPVGRPAKATAAAVAPAEDDFVSASNFNFEMPASPKGPMTRARRSSIYVGGATNRRAAATSTKLTALKEEKKTPAARRGRPSAAAVQKTPSPAKKTPARAASVRKSTRKTATKKKPATEKKMLPMEEEEEKEEFPELRLTPPSPLRNKPSNPMLDNKILSDVKVVLSRIERSPVKVSVDAAVVREALEAVAESPKGVDIVVEEIIQMASPKKKVSASSPLPGTVRTTRSARKVLPNPAGGRKVFAPANKKSSPKSNMPPASFYGTPQMADPISLLRGNLKNRVKAEMEDKISKMPPTSPYELTEEENSDEEGSPKYCFTRIADRPPKSAKAAVKYLTTGTPGHAPPKARRVLGAVDANTPKRKLNLADFEEDDVENVSPKRPRRSASGERSLNVSLEEENEIPSPVKAQPQLVTGDLAKACVIM